MWTFFMDQKFEFAAFFMSRNFESAWFYIKEIDMYVMEHKFTQVH